MAGEVQAHHWLGMLVQRTAWSLGSNTCKTKAVFRFEQGFASCEQALSSLFSRTFGSRTS